jgi:hypothetical protein
MTSTRLLCLMAPTSAPSRPSQTLGILVIVCPPLPLILPTAQGNPRRRLPSLICYSQRNSNFHYRLRQEHHRSHILLLQSRPTLRQWNVRYHQVRLTSCQGSRAVCRPFADHVAHLPVMSRTSLPTKRPSPPHLDPIRRLDLEARPRLVLMAGSPHGPLP